MMVDMEHDYPGRLAAALIRRVQAIVDDYGHHIAPGERDRIAATAHDLLHAVDTLEALEALDLADDLEDRRKESS